ncbi:MAG: hypothetical protein E4H00_10725, partial [Myxococcales bacterium]
MSTRLRDIVVQRLRSVGSRTSEGAVRRLTMDIEVEGCPEMVTLSLRDGELQCVSSDGLNDGPHVIAALRFVAGNDAFADSSPPGPMPSIPGRSLAARPPNELAEAL